jgi:hypothetical protein
MKVCRDCKHFMHPTLYREARCSHRVKVIIDPVYGTETYVGGSFYNSGAIFDCSDERAEISHVENKCGPDGKHFVHIHHIDLLPAVWTDA